MLRRGQGGQRVKARGGEVVHRAGLGVADLDRIEVVGDPLAKVARRCVPHSNLVVHRHWDQDPSSIPAPHFGVGTQSGVHAR